jgi:hypothetical protein
MKSLLLCAFSAVFLAQVAFGSSLKVFVAQTGADYRYEYTLAPQEAGDSIGGLLLFGLTGYQELSVTSPNGWFPTVPFEQDELDWIDVDPSYSATPGNSVEGFSFTSQYGPASGSYLLLLDQPNSVGDEFMTGNIFVPSTGGQSVGAPEPRYSLVLLLAALAAILKSRQNLPKPRC